jgi:Zn-dependent protease with chaperone function
MDKFIAKEYLDIKEVERKILSDRDLLESVQAIRELSDETSDRLGSMAIITLINIFIFFLKCKRPTETDLEKYRIKDEHLTELIRNITEDNETTVFIVNSTFVNAFNVGTSDLYYTTGFRERTNLTEDEMIAVCLHEYGHYYGRHFEKINIANTAIGIVVPIMLREIMVGSDMKMGMYSSSLLAMFITKILMFFINPFINRMIVRPLEYFSDSYATKKGYGRHMVSAIKKLEQLVKTKLCADKTLTQCDKIMKRLSKKDEHPSFKNRVEKIIMDDRVRNMVTTGKTNILLKLLVGIKSLFKRS